MSIPAYEPLLQYGNVLKPFCGRAGAESDQLDVANSICDPQLSDPLCLLPLLINGAPANHHTIFYQCSPGTWLSENPMSSKMTTNPLIGRPLKLITERSASRQIKSLTKYCVCKRSLSYLSSSTQYSKHQQGVAVSKRRTIRKLRSTT
ncbi:hypothetical protein DL546_009930 [Coniochaeta pulveracea]|uniref:Uncharacterized protein n=1 Tax=Coniochaeta pulveracea TaxID=177199 RepID=A0A420YHR9_9PEZI|nr:hypothetical protein DL546_009930 [Coniochaeta pulveracea]